MTAKSVKLPLDFKDVHLSKIISYEENSDKIIYNYVLNDKVNVSGKEIMEIWNIVKKIEECDEPDA